MSTPTPIQEMADAQGAYVDFDTNVKAPQAAAVKTKNDILQAMHGNPELIILYFTIHFMVSDDNASVTHKIENQLQEVSKELNYASGFRDAVSDVKAQLQDGVSGGGDPQTVTDDMTAMQAYRTGIPSGPYNPQPFTPGPDSIAPQIFQDSDDVFNQAQSDLKSVTDQIGPGKTYADFNALWTASKTQGDTKAGALIQTFTNATDTLFSGVGVQNNVLTTKLQDLEATYKSDLASDTQLWNGLLAITKNAVQKQIT